MQMGRYVKFTRIYPAVKCRVTIFRFLYFVLEIICGGKVCQVSLSR